MKRGGNKKSSLESDIRPEENERVWRVEARTMLPAIEKKLSREEAKPGRNRKRVRRKKAKLRAKST